MRNLLSFMSFLFLVISFLSCSHEDPLLEDYLVVYEHTDNEIDSTGNTSTSHKDTIIIVDTISHKDSLKNTDSIKNNSTTTKKDTFIVSYEKFMSISPYERNGQGGACFDKYYFQGYAGNAAIGVYDLEKKHALYKLDIPAPAASSKIHVNTINFGKERLSPDDYFPLLYINSGYTQNENGAPCSYIYVYRICKYNNSDGTERFHIEFVQTITLKGFGSWTEGIIDNEHNLLWIKYQTIYASFPIPKLEDGDITILKENALTEFSIGPQPFKSSHQGQLYHNNKFLLVSGITPLTEKLAFMAVDILSQRVELVIDLADIGLSDEPENLFFYKNQLMIGYRTAIYKFNVRPLYNN